MPSIPISCGVARASSSEVCGMSSAVTAPAVIASMSTGVAPPFSHAFWPAALNKYSWNRRAAAGCGASLLIAWL